MWQIGQQTAGSERHGGEFIESGNSEGFEVGKSSLCVKELCVEQVHVGTGSWSEALLKDAVNIT